MKSRRRPIILLVMCLHSLTNVCDVLTERIQNRTQQEEGQEQNRTGQDRTEQKRDKDTPYPTRCLHLVSFLRIVLSRLVFRCLVLVCVLFCTRLLLSWLILDFVFVFLFCSCLHHSALSLSFVFARVFVRDTRDDDRDRDREYVALPALAGVLLLPPVRN